ncbi:MAG: hypothetical protein P4L16_06635, partial [Chlamydiales bacterium]|nr:hypothetical protein [Chlamydiales bacterium]
FVSLGAVGCYAAGKMFNQDQHYNHPAYGDSLLLYNMSQYTEYPQLSYYDSLHHSKNDVKKEPYSVYTPDRPLPRDEKTKEPLPDTSDPHTQLGTRDGRNGPYAQAREFDENGKPVRDIDFTNHGRPNDHTNPHQHMYTPNFTGGSLIRGDSTPVPNWRMV